MEHCCIKWVGRLRVPEAHVQVSNMRNVGSLQLHQARLDLLTNTNESRQHQSDGASCKGRRALPSHARLTSPIRGLERCPAGCSFPCLHQRHLLGQKRSLVHNSREHRFLLPLLEVSHHLVFTTTATRTTYSGPSPSRSLSLFWGGNAECQEEKAAIGLSAPLIQTPKSVRA